MNPEPAMLANRPFVVDGRVWRRIVIALYLASSAAAVFLRPGVEYDLAWVPGLGWVANLAIVLAAIALARTHAPLRLQLALPFAAPVLLVLHVSMTTYSGAFAGWNVLMVGVLFGWAFYSYVYGSLIAFAIALAALASRRTSRQPDVVTQRPVGPGVLLRTFSTLGWVVAAAWLYILGFVLTANMWPEYRPYLEGPPWGIFKAATVIGWGLAPPWLAGAIALFLSSFRRKQRPAVADTAVLILVACLIGVYLFFVYIED
ncbi:MAG TPA: hypothetical protein VNM67_25660 [Thermoanaerobaculia bacterium]|jgi:hypothetical protein|nr:hypothetical protein [Thermoanaerobaculia bacterium]